MKYLSSVKLHAAVFLLILSLAFAVRAQAKPKNADNEVTVTGTVTDEKGNPVSGVIVITEGTLSGSTTDRYGKYSISVPSDAELVFSSIGYKDKKVALNGKSVLDVTIDFENDPINDEEEIGYGTQKKVLATNATLQVKGDDITKLSTTSALGALQSQAPGVVIASNSGQPGQGYKVNIRGISSNTDSSPLYVIDGIPGGDINQLNPSDIESVEVLKDAASAAIYGSRAGNGVILVTTKRGREGRTIVSYDGYVGKQYISKMPDLCDANQYVVLQNEMNFNTVGSLLDWDSMLPEGLYSAIKSGTYTGTNWFKEMYNEGALTQNHALNVTGGSADHNFSIGLTYTGQDGTLGKNEIESVYSKYKRATFRANSDHVAIKSRRGDFNVLTFGETLTFSMGRNNGLAEGNVYNNSIHNALSADPLTPVYKYYDDWSIAGFFDREARQYNGWTWNSSTRTPNPIAQDVYTNGNNLSKFYTLNTNLYAKLEPVKNLKIKSQLGYNLSADDYRSGVKEYALADHYFNSYEMENSSLSTRHKLVWENTISYHLDVKKHAFDFLAGQSVERYFADVKLKSRNVTSRTTANLNDSDDASLASFFGRIDYNYDERYVLSAVIRADGSSIYPSSNRWGYFPSVSAGWVISNEKWMKPASKWLSLLKIRASWGKNGNSHIDKFFWGSLYNSVASASSGTLPFAVANPDIKWETTEQTNIGIDARFLDSRLALSVDGYVKTTRDWLIPELTYGGNPTYYNGGDVRNSGVEVTLGWGERRGDFTYSINLNGAWNRNEVLRVANAEGVIHGQDNALYSGAGETYRIQEGSPVGVFYGYKTKGVWQTHDQIELAMVEGKAMFPDTKMGDIIIADLDKDGAITDKDRTVIGDPNPDFTAGLNFSFGYRGFDLGIAGYGAFGHQIAKSYRSFIDSPGDNFSGEYLTRWCGTGTSNKYPRLTANNFSRNWTEFTDLYIEDGDYFKISNITLGYDFKRLIRAAAISRLRLYFTVQNPFTFTKYSGLDPEVTYRGGESWASGIDIGYYPNPRTYLMGLNIQF